MKLDEKSSISIGLVISLLLGAGYVFQLSSRVEANQRETTTRDDAMEKRLDNQREAIRENNRVMTEINQRLSRIEGALGIKDGK